MKKTPKKCDRAGNGKKRTTATEMMPALSKATDAAMVATVSFNEERPQIRQRTPKKNQLSSKFACV